MSRPGLCAAQPNQVADGNPALPLGWPDSTKIFATAGIEIFFDGFADIESDPVQDVGHLGRKIAELYKKSGAGFLQQLRGSFALALWDAPAQRLILAVDPFATRPLYYGSRGGVVAFARRLSPFTEAAIFPREIDFNTIYFYLNHSFIPGPYTVFRGIKRLEPGNCFIWEKGVESVKSYWDMTYDEEPAAGEHAVCAMLRTAMEDSVAFHLRDLKSEQIPYGAFLSGGVDSSTLLGLISQLTGQTVKSFSVGFNEARYNEIYYARIASARFNAEPHEYFVRPEEALPAMAHLAEDFDEPFGNSSAIPTYFCLKMAREAGVQVMFAGDGGDELFGGNERYAAEKTFMLYQDIPSWARAPIDYISAMLPLNYPWCKIRNYVQKANQPVADRFFAYQLYMRDHAESYFTADFCAAIDCDFPIQIPREHYRRSSHVSPLNRLLYMDLKLAIADNDLFKVNRMAERLGVQVRYPYLDKQVGLASGRIPANLKVKGWKKRYIFKKAFESLLPAEILSKKKHGFGLPTGEWLRSDPGFRELARSLLLDSRAIGRGYFKRQALENLLSRHDAETSSYYGSHIWNFMMLELWHRNHYEVR